jgi:hypothetical protein
MTKQANSSTTSSIAPEEAQTTILFYSSYNLRRRLQMTKQANSSTTSSIAPEEAQTAAILGCKLGYVDVL